MSAREQPIEIDGRSFAARLFFKTPLRDLARGRVSGSLDWASHPRRAGLPPALVELTVNVTNRTRLRRLEKIDVARELAAHFAEGIAAGKDTGSLIEEFGAWKQAAKLIRRAKKRNRSRIIRYTSRAMGGAFAAVALLYLGVLVWFIAGRGTVNPSHDYLADMNAAAASVMAEDRAWPVYREVFLDLGTMPDELACSGPADYRWPVARAYTEEHQAAIGKLRDAAAMPGLGYLMDNRLHEADRRLFDPDGDRAAAGANEDRSNKIPTVGALLPQIGTLRASARLLGHDARRLMELGEFEESIADIEAMQGIARHAGEHPTLISQLVRISVQALAIDTARRLLESAGGALSAQDLTRLDRAFDPAITGDLAAITFDGERLIIRDVEQHSYTDNGAGNGRLRPVMLAYTDVSNPIPESSVFLGAPYSAIMPDRKSFRAMADSLYQAAERESEIPLWERGESDLGRLIASAERSAYTSMRWMYLLSFVPAYQRVLSKSDLAAMERDALRATIAMHRYRLGHGRWPERLTDLVPAYLDALPIDHYTGAPLRYRSDEAGAGAPKLYSVGHNFRDDGGAAATDRDGWPSNDPAMRWRPRSEVDPDDASIRGDIMFWPPLPEKPLEPLPEDD